jgi:hypothetical protein
LDDADADEARVTVAAESLPGYALRGNAECSSEALRG